jgi:dTDP-4-amino-4,6-dideoxygalactose transaminase
MAWPVQWPITERLLATTSDASVARAEIPQTLPLASYLAHREEIDAAIARVLEGGSYILGRETEAFEAEFAAYVGVEHGIGVASGTDAIEIALRAVGVVPGDGVVTVSNTAVATVAAIERAGAVPVLVDIEPDSMTLDPQRFEAALQRNDGPRVTAVVPVHLFGAAADLTAILSIAESHGVHVVEDVAQAHGATLGDRRLGAWGDAAAFSFYPTKNLGAFGDGGLITTNRIDVADRARQLRQYGWKTRFVSDVPGLNSRLDELHAAMLRVGLRYLDSENDRRRQIAERYRSGLSGLGLTLPVERQNSQHVFHQFAIRSLVRDELRNRLAARGVGTAIHYPVPIHLQPAYFSRLPSRGDLSESERAAATVLSLPMHPHLSEADVGTVMKAVRQAVAEQ